MSMNPESKKTKLHGFADWVNANSEDIPPAIVYPPKDDDHGGHGHGDGHDDHGGHGHGDGHGDHGGHGHGDGHGDHGGHGHGDGHDDHGGHGHGDGHGDHGGHSHSASAQRPFQESGLYKIIGLVCGVLMVLVLLFTVAALPRFGSVDSPTLNEVSRRYLEDGLSETGALNTVAGIILDYRAFDTLGESMVLFTASITVVFLLSQFIKETDEKEKEDSEDQAVRSMPARVIIRMVLPIILLYGIYIVFNGHLSPGGGFSGGTILGAGWILSHLAFGESYTKRFITIPRCIRIMSGALMVYIGLKLYSILTGANHIPSIIPLGEPGSIFSGGLIFPLNICVGLVVACTLYAIYNLFCNWSSYS